MTTTAAIEVSTTLAATPEAMSSNSASASHETAEVFNRVLDEQTAKALDENETARDRRDTTSKSTKRNLATSDVASPATASSLEAASAAGVHPSAEALRSTVDVGSKDTNEPTSAPTASTEELARASHTPEQGTDESSGGADALGVAADPSSVSLEVGDGSSSTTDATEASPTITSLAGRATVETKDEDRTRTGEKSDAASVTNAEAIEVAPSATLASAATSTISSASSAIRTWIPSPGNATPSRAGVPRTAPSASVSADSVSSVSRRTTEVGDTTARTYDEPVVTQNVGSTARSTVSTPNSTGSSTADASSLDVTELATSISQAVLGSDGSYTLNVAMHPSDLGHVQAVVSLNGDELHVAITPQTPAGHVALANAVDSLKSDLSRSGLNVNVSLRDPESRSGRGNEDAPRISSTETDIPLAEGEASDVSKSLTVSQIHLIL